MNAVRQRHHLVQKKRKVQIQCTSCGRCKGQIHRTRPSRSTSAENVKVHTEHFHSGGATTWTFIVVGAKDISSFVMCSPVPWNTVVNLTTRHYRTNPCECSRHTSSGRKCRGTCCFFTSGIQLEQHFQKKHKHSTPIRTMFSSGSTQVFSWSISAVDLSSVS